MKFVMILAAVLFSVVSARLYEKCELAQELFQKYKIPLEKVGPIVCIAESQARLRTEAMLIQGKNKFFGLFQVGSEWWCNEDETPGKGCNLQCSKLLHDDITDDVECLNAILKEHSLKSGFGDGAKCLARANLDIEHCVNGKKYDQCELAQELQSKHELAKEEIASLVCIASYESAFNTGKLKSTKTDGAFYGMFQIHDGKWCRRDDSTEYDNECNLDCGKLLDGDLTDDIECVKKINDDETFRAWRTYDLFCSGGRAVKFIENCSKTATEIISTEVAKQIGEREALTNTPTTFNFIFPDNPVLNFGFRKPETASFNK